MGCDIHVYIEKKVKGEDDAGRWGSFNFYTINPGRDYARFGRLAGVRSEQEHIPPRGFPADASFAATCDHWLSVTPDEQSHAQGVCSKANAENWVLRGYSQWRDDRKTAVSNPDHHSHSFLTLAEWKKAVEPFESVWDADWRALTAVAQSYEDNGHEARFLFYFDN